MNGLFQEVKAPNDLPAGTWLKVFLAGSIEMGTAEDWQVRLSAAIRERCVSIPTLVMNPRRDNWDPSWKQSLDEPRFVQQVHWELHALEQADVIAMRFVPGTMSPISLLEFGLYARLDRMVVLCPEGYWRKGNVDITAAWYGVQQVETEEQLIEAVVARLLRTPVLLEDARTWCPQCGPRVSIDEDGCCMGCGSTATGDGADRALKAVAERDLLRKSTAVAIRQMASDGLAIVNAATDLRMLRVERDAARGELERVRKRLTDGLYHARFALEGLALADQSEKNAESRKAFAERHLARVLAVMDPDQVVRTEVEPDGPEHHADLAATARFLAQLSNAKVDEARAFLDMRNEELDHNDALAWVGRNFETLRRHVGREVAIHPREGIIAVGDSAQEVAALIQGHPDFREVLLYTVPAE